MQKQCDNVILELTVPQPSRRHDPRLRAFCPVARLTSKAFSVCQFRAAEHSRIWLLVNDDQRLGQMISQIEKLEDVTKVARNQSDPTMFNKIAVFFELALKA